MAQDNVNQQYSYPAGADLTNKLYLAVEVTSGQVTVCNSAGEVGLGILYSEASAAGRQVAVAVEGIVKVVLNATLAAGVEVSTTNAGKMAQATTGQRTWGMLLTGGAANEIATMLLYAGKPIFP